MYHHADIRAKATLLSSIECRINQLPAITVSPVRSIVQGWHLWKVNYSKKEFTQDT